MSDPDYPRYSLRPTHRVLCCRCPFPSFPLAFIFLLTRFVFFWGGQGVSFTMAEASFTNTDNASYSLATATSNGTSAAVSATASAAASVSDNSTYPSAIATIPAVNYSNDLGHVSSVVSSPPFPLLLLAHRG